jgi:hypothetical protein
MQSRWKAIAPILMMVVLAGLLQPTRTDFAEDRDFNRLVKEMESRFHAKRIHVPLFGVAKPVIKVMRPGSKSLETAIFEDQDFSAVDTKEFAELAGKALGPDWHLMVRVVSRRDGEQIFLYLRECRDYYKLITATLEPNEAVLVELKLNSKDLLELIDHPEEMGKAAKTEKEDESE